MLNGAEYFTSTRPINIEHSRLNDSMSGKRRPNSGTRFKVAVSGKVQKSWPEQTNLAAITSVEEVIEMVTTDSLTDEDENNEFIEESDNFEDVMSQKLDELGEYAAEIQEDFDQETF